MINFSNLLEKEGIYSKIIEEKISIIDKPIMVIPVKDDLSNFDIDNTHFIFYNKDKENQFMLQIREKDKSNNKEIITSKTIALKDKTILTDIHLTKNNISVKIILDLEKNEKKWGNILRNLNYYNYREKFDKQSDYNSCIDGNKATMSYSVFIFSFHPNMTKEKIERMYKEENIKKGLFFDEKEREKESKIINLLCKLSDSEISEKIWKKIELFKTYSEQERFFVIIKLPNNIIEENYGNSEYNYNNNIYGYFYEKYWEKKSFNTENKSLKKSGEKLYKCGACGENSSFVNLPSSFNNEGGGKKPFLKHYGRYTDSTIKVCNKCAFTLAKFNVIFLKTLKITIFPLFIDEMNRPEKEQIELIRSDLSKIGFKEILDEIGKKTNHSSVMDFYLIIRGDEIIFFDYITGFKYRFEYDDKRIEYYKVEEKISSFFNNIKNTKGSYLYSNYFSEVDVKDSTLKYLIYKYRGQIFDYFYRAKYNSLDDKIIEKMFFELILWSFNLFHSKEINEYIIKEKMNNYKELNKIFGGNFMNNFDREKEKVEDNNSFFYFLGQAVHFLLSKSKTSEKTHSMVIPFLQVSSINVIMEHKLLPLFERYSYEISMDTRNKFNKIVSELLKYYGDNKNLDFNQDNKLVFLAGYLDDNIMYKKEKNIND